ncbi:hypothetical protein Dip518_000382 [Parelusimicrobium proximum]
MATDDWATTFAQLDVTPAPGCNGTGCQIGKDYLWMSSNLTDSPVYLNATGQDTSKLTMAIVFNENGSNAVDNNLKKGDIICYDRGNASWTKVCNSFAPSVSYPWGNGTAWVIR